MRTWYSLWYSPTLFVLQKLQVHVLLLLLCRRCSLSAYSFIATRNKCYVHICVVCRAQDRQRLSILYGPPPILSASMSPILSRPHHYPGLICVTLWHEHVKRVAWCFTNQLGSKIFKSKSCFNSYYSFLSQSYCLDWRLKSKFWLK